MNYWFFCFVLLFSHCICGTSEGAMQLIERLRSAQTGDYIVTAIDNTYTALIIKEKSNEKMSIEEITIPLGRIQNNQNTWMGWRKWVESGAPGNTSWVMYTVNSSTGQMTDYFSFTKNARCNVSSIDHFLSKLLTLKLKRLPKKDTKRVGPPPPKGSKDARRSWTPQMIYEGKVITDVNFEAWRTEWPQDGGELSGKVITVYVPNDDNRYPSYFPYWLEIQGMIGKAKVRIIDSGRNLNSPQKAPINAKKPCQR